MAAVLFAGLASAMFGTSFGQEACDWYRWAWNDWAPDQNFLQLLKSQDMGDAYLNQSDFEEGGDFYGQTWEEVFWSGVNHTADPPTAYYRPLGFRYAKLGPFNNPTICLQAQGVAGYKVELMVYTLTPAASLCMEDMSADQYDAQDTGAMATCDSQYIYNCFTADTTTNTLQVSVYCNTNCEDESNVHVLWRFRRSALTWDDDREFSSQNPEMWCDMIARDINWPDEIDEAIPDTYKAGDNVGSSGNMINGLLASAVIGVLAFFY